MSGEEDRNKIVPQYETLHFIELQEMGRLFESELVGRYLSNPDNLDKIRATVRAAMEQLSLLARPGNNMCPDGWIHTNGCRCVVQPFAPAIPFSQVSGEYVESLEPAGTQR